MQAMADLCESQAIRAVGVSNFSAGQMRRAHAALKERGIVLASNQVRFNLWDRSIETNGVLDTARELGVSIIAYSPLEVLGSIADAHGVTRTAMQVTLDEEDFRRLDEVRR